MERLAQAMAMTRSQGVVYIRHGHATKKARYCGAYSNLSRVVEDLKIGLIQLLSGDRDLEQRPQKYLG
jgi:hypothetical protein